MFAECDQSAKLHPERSDPVKHDSPRPSAPARVPNDAPEAQRDRRSCRKRPGVRRTVLSISNQGLRVFSQPDVVAEGCFGQREGARSV